MRWIVLFLAALGGLQAQEGLDSARVTINYRELRELIEAARKTPPPPAPVAVPFAVLAAEYDFAADDKLLEGTATFVVQTFTDGSHLIPLVGNAARITRVEPVDSLLVLRDGSYALAVEGKTRLKITLRLAIPLCEADGGRSTNLSLSPCPLSRLRLTNVQPNETANVEGGVNSGRDKDTLLWELGGAASLNLSIQRQVDKPAVVALTGNRVEMPSIVRTAMSDMRVVRDGSYMNAMQWTIRHDGALNWTLAMPDDCELLLCKVGGQPVAPILQDARTWVIQLPAPKSGDESLVELSYTGRQSAFQPVRGEFTGTLPGTSLLVEKLEWRLQIPVPYEAVAIQGNVDFVPGPNASDLRLTRELGRGDAASVHVFYQKPEKP